MEFSNCDDVLRFLKSNYCKLLIVNLEQDSYCPKIIADDELEAMGELDCVFSHYTNWFVTSKFIMAEDRDALRSFFASMQAGKSITYRRLINGEYHRVLLLLEPTVNPNELLLYVRDVDEIYNQERERILEKDEQTGLLNRHAFYRDCKQHKGKSVGILYADLNGLKYTNDHFGHDEGDKLIIKLANLLKLNFQWYKCYHISGDEFIVAAFGLSLQDFLVNAMAFHKSMWSAMDKPIASIGYSIGEAGINSIEDTVRVAERSMQNDKLMFYQRFPKYKRE